VKTAPKEQQGLKPHSEAGPLKEDGITNPRDGRGPLRSTSDQSVKLPRPDKPSGKS
jgi:hypothetical protein